MKKSRYIGVEYINSVNPLDKPWRVRIVSNGNNKFSENFATELEAVQTYNELAEKWGMETNLIREVYYEYDGKLYTESEWEEFEAQRDTK